MAVIYEQRGDVAMLTLNRPDVYNAVDAELSAELVEALRRAGGEARVAVITGAGRAFCSGADLAALAGDYQAGEADLAGVIEKRFNPIIEALARARMPTIAAVKGAAAGAGLGMALACDLRVMATDAYFTSAFIKVALIPDSGSTWLLAASVGVSRAMEIAFSGRRVEAEEARSLGLAHRVVEPEALTEEAVSWAAELANGPTHAYVATRELIHAATAVRFKEALELEREAQGRLGSHPAHLEGVRAFMEKRPPDFRMS